MSIDDVSLIVERLFRDAGITVPDPEYGRRCAQFASQIFSAVWHTLELSVKDHKLVVAAALLHEAGSVVSRRDQHRKTYDIIRSAALPGFSDSERVITACAARYHGGPYPNIEHAGFMDMSAYEQRVVRRIAAIGRVAAALDSSHLGVIDRIEVSIGDRGVGLVAYADHEPAVESDSLREVEGSFLMLTQVRLSTRVSVANNPGCAASDDNA